MNINCVICSDLFEPSSEVHITQCGHMFHYTCLMHWIERSRTCPQCRNRCTDKTIHRVYFNLANSDHVDDAGSLQFKLDNLSFQMTLKEKDIKMMSEKYNKMKRNTTALRGEVQVLEQKQRMNESAMHALNEQISFFKKKSKDCDRLSEELTKMKNRLKDAHQAQQVIDGSREAVNDMIRNEHNLESLATLAAVLKKSLVDSDWKKRDLEHKLKIAQNDATKYKREANTLECKYNDAKRELDNLKVNWSQEKQYLKNKIVELDKKRTLGNDVSMESNETDNSIKRIMEESPINFNRKPRLNRSDLIDLTESPTLEQKVKQIVDSDSPYLPVKSSSVGLLNTKFSTKPSTSSQYTIFKAPPNKLENVKVNSQKNEEINYNGLGGSSRLDIFPSPKPTKTGLKRHQSSTSVSSAKFRKLAPMKTFLSGSHND